jgi:hypothetical protein
MLKGEPDFDSEAEEASAAQVASIFKEPVQVGYNSVLLTLRTAWQANRPKATTWCSQILLSARSRA